MESAALDQGARIAGLHSRSVEYDDRLYSILQIIQTTGYSVTFTLLSGGLRVAFIAPIYGLIIYALSLLLRIAVKPRI